MQVEEKLQDGSSHLGVGGPPPCLAWSPGMEGGACLVTGDEGWGRMSPWEIGSIRIGVEGGGGLVGGE